MRAGRSFSIRREFPGRGAKSVRRDEEVWRGQAKLPRCEIMRRESCRERPEGIKISANDAIGKPHLSYL